MKPKTHTPDRIFALEAPLRQAARLIARSHCPAVLRHDVLVRLKQLIAEENAAVLRKQNTAASWFDGFAA